MVSVWSAVPDQDIEGPWGMAITGLWAASIVRAPVISDPQLYQIGLKSLDMTSQGPPPPAGQGTLQVKAPLLVKGPLLAEAPVL